MKRNQQIQEAQLLSSTNCFSFAVLLDEFKMINDHHMCCIFTFINARMSIVTLPPPCIQLLESAFKHLQPDFHSHLDTECQYSLLLF